MKIAFAKTAFASIFVAVAFSANARLPTYQYIQGDSVHRVNEINPMLPSHYIVNEDKDVMIEGELYDAKEVYALGGPIRYYVIHIMPRIKGEPLFLPLNDASIKWRDQNMPLKVPGQIRKPTSRNDSEIKAIQDRYIARLAKQRNEICTIYNEYVANGIDTKNLHELCARWRKNASSKYWRDLKTNAKSNRDKAERELANLLDQGRSFDVDITKAYSPIIDVKLEKYKAHISLNSAETVNPHIEQEIAKAKRDASVARREARDAREAAEAAEAKAEEISRRQNMGWNEREDHPASGAMFEAMRIKAKRAEKQRRREQGL